MDASRLKRLEYSKMVLDNPDLMSPLLQILFMVDDPTSVRAAWILEFVCRERLNYLFPHLDIFTEKLNTIHLDSAVRPIAKVCECLAEDYYGITNFGTKNVLSKQHIEAIVEACFDYMISDHKIAPKAYSMNTLYLFGQNIDWIYPELKSIIQRDYSKQSAGYKARARHILKKINRS